MDLGLIERITGVFPDSTPVERCAPSERLPRSIAGHIRELVTTRQGSLAHIPRYGVPDIAVIRRNLPEGAGELRTAIERTVGEFECRLKNIRVSFTGSSDTGDLTYELVARTCANTPFCLHISFDTNSSAVIEPRTRSRDSNHA